VKQYVVNMLGDERANVFGTGHDFDPIHNMFVIHTPAGDVFFNWSNCCYVAQQDAGPHTGHFGGPAPGTGVDV
jgi:hypothetical protein